MNSFGHILRLTTFGESHGPAIGGVLDGVPAGIAVDPDFVQRCLDRRRPGSTAGSTTRPEADRIELLSGIYEGRTLGTPIGFIIRNTAARPADYEHMRDVCRPSHADYTYMAKYGRRDHRGGGRASARETACRVAAGAICLQALEEMGISIAACTSAIGGIVADADVCTALQGACDNALRCPDAAAAARMESAIAEARAAGDTLGGTVTCIVRGVPPGLGEPVGAKLNALLGAAMLSINAVKGVEFGDGFAAATSRGSLMNDAFTAPARAGGQPGFASNHSGGIQGGISNGADIVVRVAFKPVPTLMGDIHGALGPDGQSIVTLAGRGRHDVCVVPRAVAVVEAMAALTLLDAILMNRCARI